MSYRFMRVIVMFDLPTDTSLERRRYRLFRKSLINEGFTMMQESIYTKICINQHAVDKVEREIRKQCPADGLVQILAVTERQFTGMELLVGSEDNVYIQNEERLIIL